MAGGVGRIGHGDPAEHLLRDTGIDAAALAEFAHGTTVATNSILEKKGARVGLLTTTGFRDVLEIGRLRRPTLFDITWEKPQVLVRRQLRLEVDERIDHLGRVEVPLDERQALARQGRGSGWATTGPTS